ncbi:UNVERIFIED_CONTAM: hypothetical protein Slati_2186400 [Sesamum latifolium]|uniref:CCHC-type domain-containing protein n=1 Tax=Sesamum latifolium TaxID=2727402 RepID=A0AAW2WSD7_9LAMI
MNWIIRGFMITHLGPMRRIYWCLVWFTKMKIPIESVWIGAIFILVHDLPIGKMNKDIATFIGDQLSKFRDVDMDNSNGLWGTSMRIRMSLDITKPLRRVLKLKTTMGDELLVPFTYEKLPNLCYLCGRLGHLSKACELQLADGFIDSGSNAPFGPWLRAQNTANNRNHIPPSRPSDTARTSGRPKFVSHDRNQSQHNEHSSN